MRILRAPSDCAAAGHAIFLVQALVNHNGKIVNKSLPISENIHYIVAFVGDDDHIDGLVRIQQVDSLTQFTVNWDRWGRNI